MAGERHGHGMLFVNRPLESQQCTLWTGRKIFFKNLNALFLKIVIYLMITLHCLKRDGLLQEYVLRNLMCRRSDSLGLRVCSCSPITSSTAVNTNGFALTTLMPGTSQPVPNPLICCADQPRD